MKFAEKTDQINWKFFKGTNINAYIKANDFQTLESLISNAVYSKINSDDFYISDHRDFFLMCLLG